MKNLVPADAPAVPVQQMFWLLVAASAALIWILLPFYGPIMWGIVIALLFAPVFRRLLQRLGQRHGRCGAHPADRVDHRDPAARTPDGGVGA